MEIIVPGIEDVKSWWKPLLREPELVDRSILIFQRWRGEPTIAIPCGKYRRAGSLVVEDEVMEEVLRKLRMRPCGFSDLRFALEDSSGGESIVWGEDVTPFWRMREDDQPAQTRIEGHRNLGRAFGYREEEIMSVYTDDFFDDKIDPMDRLADDEEQG